MWFLVSWLDALVHPPCRSNARRAEAQAIALARLDNDPLAAEFCVKRVGVCGVLETEAHVISRRLMAPIGACLVGQCACVTEAVHGRQPLTKAGVGNQNRDLMREVAVDLALWWLRFCGGSSEGNLYGLLLKIAVDLRNYGDQTSDLCATVFPRAY
jgi:hypothetical protein